MKNESYEEYVEKFKPKKTTDDCYTPPEKKSIFGGGLLLSEKAAAEKKNAIVFELSEREKDLVRQLGI